PAMCLFVPVCPADPCFFISCLAVHRDLHSFPTRRSSDLYIKNYKFWFVFAFITLILSQILILMFWKDAKFGTLANVLIFLVSLYAYGKFQFNNMVKNETKQVLQHISAEKPSVILEKDLTHLPEIVEKWLQTSGVAGQEQSRLIRLKQIGEMRTKPEGRWMPFI